jgi:hypothetical protein
VTPWFQHWAETVIGSALLIAQLLGVIWLARKGIQNRQRRRQRGFEVKQPTGGESPVVREKESGHG